MSDPGTRGGSPTAEGAHFSCSLTAVMLAQLHEFGGDEAVGRLLHESGVKRTPEYLCDIGNWVSYDEAVALWDAGQAITRNPHFARRLGEAAAKVLNASPVAALLRSLGSPEAAYRQMTVMATKFSVITEQEAVDVGPGYAEIRFTNREGFPRNPHHCAWTESLLTQTPVLFGLAPARVEHERCAVLGEPDCVYHVSWDTESDHGEVDPAARTEGLEDQLAAMTERLQSMFATASDLIAAGDLDVTLAAITDRAALEVRAPRYLLAVRPETGGELHLHHRGLTDEDAVRCAERIGAAAADDLPDSWLVVPVRSHRHHYGHLLALCEEGTGFFSQEHELLEVYARYAATALDTATALREAKRRHEQASALLELARALATAGTTDEVARRLAEAVPAVIDCDRVGVYLWDEETAEIRRRAVTGGQPGDELPEWSLAPDEGGLVAQWLEHPDQEPVFVDQWSGNERLREMFSAVGALATIVVPIASSTRFLGALAVSVQRDPRRLAPTPDLLDRLSGVAAHATTALENGRLVDNITHQAHHDSLTGLANRAQLRQELVSSTAEGAGSAPFTLFYIDLDGFKPINDQFGHDVGDALLRGVAERLLTGTRDGDIVARLGGDEFAVLVSGANDPAVIAVVAERLAAGFATPFDVDGHALKVGASIGHASWPADAPDIDALIRHADGAMYEQKRTRHTDRARAA